MSEIVVSTKKTLFEAITVRLNEQVYPVIVTADVMKRITETVKELKKVEGDPGSVLVDQVVIYTGAEKDIVKKLDVRDLRRIVESITNQIAVTELPGESEEKNGSKPVETK